MPTSKPLQAKRDSINDQLLVVKHSFTLVTLALSEDENSGSSCCGNGIKKGKIPQSIQPIQEDNNG